MTFEVKVLRSVEVNADVITNDLGEGGLGLFNGRVLSFGWRE
jgi:hypothetical protein